MPTNRSQFTGQHTSSPLLHQQPYSTSAHTSSKNPSWEVLIPLAFDTASSSTGLYNSNKHGFGLTPPWVLHGIWKYSATPIVILGGTSAFGSYVIMKRTHELEFGRVFPSEWKVGWALFTKFVAITSGDLIASLSKAGSSLMIKALLEALRQTIDFESSMAKKWLMPFNEILEASSPPSSATVQSMSSAFEPHLGVFVDAQDKALADMLATHRVSSSKAKPRTSLDTTPRDSISIILYRRSDCADCTLPVNRTALFDLCMVHKKWLRRYAEDVLAPRSKRPAVQTLRSMDSRFDVADLQQAALVINTADYCQTTALEPVLFSALSRHFHESWRLLARVLSPQCPVRRGTPPRLAGGVIQTTPFDSALITTVVRDIFKAGLVLGLKVRALEVTAEDGYALHGETLEVALKENVDAVFHPSVLVAAIGTTSSGAVDRLDDISNVAKRYPFQWLHVDAVALVCPEYREAYQLPAIDHYADSFCTNFHKWGLINFDAPCLWVRHRKHLADARDVTPEFERSKHGDAGTVIDYRNWHLGLSSSDRLNSGLFLVPVGLWGSNSI
ncbi:hypothetical protein EDD22DRAFT_1016813 [Suillus occidentalis]|nr:hypothetical protein EDD22DRAFT_1016813 [Suillus occidentalis]